MIHFNSALGKFYENGKELNLPELKNEKYIHKVTQVNDKLYCNGYEWKDNKWQINLTDDSYTIAYNRKRIFLKNLK